MNYITFNKRIFISILLIIILNIILIIKLYYMQIINFNIYYNKSYKNCTKLIKIFPKRGIIFDRNGLILAKNNILYQLEIYNDKKFKKNINEFIKIIKLSDEEINDIFLLKNKNFKKKSIIIKRKFNESEIINFLVNKFFFPNIKIKKIYYRYYPFKYSSAHSVGYISKINKLELINLNKKKNNNYNFSDYIGKIGIEKKYENFLKGKKGFKEIEINNLGKELRIKNIILPNEGKDIYLSIDIKLNEFINKLTKNSKAAIIVTDIRNGEILSLVSNPSYDPNNFYKGMSEEKFNKILLNNSYPMLNRVTQGIYPPASTIKPYISLYALHENFIDKNYLIFDNIYWTTPKLNKTYKDWKKNGRGWIKLTQAIEESSDIYFYNLAYQCGIRKLFNYINSFYYGKKTGIDLLEESIGILPNDVWKKKRFKKSWCLGDTISVGIGQGYLSVTPIQMSKALMILINNGNVKIPHLLKYIYDFSLNKKYFYKINKKNNKLKDDIKIKNWNIIKNGMYKVANSDNGTAKQYFKNTYKYKIGAKSGTAQLYSIKDHETYNINKVPKHLKDHKLMISFAPFDKPIFSIVIVLENGGFDKFNSGEITKKIFDYLILNKKNNKLYE